MKTANPARRRVALLAITSAVAAAPRSSAALPPDAYNRLVQSVVRVRSIGCPEGPRVGTGFVATDGDGRPAIITARHVVGGCTSSTVAFVGADFIAKDPPLTTTLARNYGPADLALLKIDSQQTTPPLTPLRVAATAPAPNSSVFAAGFWLGATGVTEKSYTLALGPSRLRGLLGAEILEDLTRYGSPSPDVDILNLGGPLPPGGSGAPIVNGSLEVVGVADGGLERGAAGVSFAIPSSEIAKLLVSNAPRPTASEGKVLASLHAADTQAASGVTVACPGFSVTRTRSTTIKDAMRSTDAAPALAQILGWPWIAGITNLEAEAIDVYSDISTGATFVLPTGYSISPAGTVCIARDPSRNIGIKMFERTGITDQATSRAAMTTFEQAMLVGDGWALDFELPTFSRFDGLGMRSHAFKRQEGSSFRDAIFVRSMLRRQTYAASAAVLLNFFDASSSNPYCSAHPESALCKQLASTRREYARAVLAIALTTFAVS